MIVLDTNVVSALMRPAENRVVIDWLDRQPRDDVWTTAISLYEVRYGLWLMHPGRRRDTLTAAFQRISDDVVNGHILPFDEEAAERSAAISAKLRRTGRDIGIPDAQIAGIALARRAALATRNTRHFHDLDITLVDPWTA